MWFEQVVFSDILNDGRWKVEFFIGNDSKIDSAYQIIPLGDIVEERKESIEPRNYPDDLFNYIGLENVESLTGDLVSFVPKHGRDIRSRSKIFKRDDLLYGRLRPYLNKIFFANREVSEGTCSTEFYVLKVNKNVVKPILLRALLASEFVLKFTARFQSGAALPRISKKDFFSLPIPLPPMEHQKNMLTI